MSATDDRQETNVTNRTPASAVRDRITAEPQEAAWSIDTPSLTLGWARMDAGDVRLTSLRTAGREWLAAPVPVFSLVDDPAAEISFRDVTGTVDGATLRLRGTLRPSGLTVTTAWTVDAEASVVLVEIEVANERDVAVTLGSLSSLRVSVERDGRARLGTLSGGRWDESMPPRGYRLRTTDLDEIGADRSIGVADDGRSSGEHVPWFALMDQAGGLLAGLVWSGRWRLDARRRDDAVSLVAGIADVAHVLQPGERLALPGMLLLGYAGELDDGANAWRDWLVAHWTPPVPASWPWVQYNHWYAYYGDIDEDRLFAEAEHAAAMGCEVFVIDDGWFLGRRPDSYYQGWGNWHEDPAKFPHGLRAFGDRVRGLGMTFGLWVEPERADDSGELARAHPDWIATRHGEPVSRPGPSGAEGVHLCLGNPEVQRWMADEMIRVVHEYGVDWLKWDYNIGYGLGCDAADHGHQATDGHYAHTLGLYWVFERLREACPDLVIENCASGGHRVDLGTLRHTHTNWVSDYSHRAASCRQHVQGAGLFLPLHHLNTWVLHDRDTATEFRSRMGGAFGVSSFMGQWSEEERAALATAIAEYKRLRPYLGGHRFLLTGPLHQDWDVWQFVHPDGAGFALLAFREGGRIGEARVTPRVPDTQRTYRVERTGMDGPTEVAGTALASEGVAIRLDERGSEVLWVTPID